ncbi:ABC transporter permease [Pseudomonas sp.]|uniref:ABC transporter permease n=1 Tax=Pseudomonas sp. TaxID=306 RepID=UPI00260BC2B2|nr:ABC transporter permease [Pseudomonas sp.]
MRHFSASPREMAASLWRNKNLIRTAVKRDVLGRYRGSVMGIIWSFLNPLLMLTVYTVVFSVIFKARWGTGNGSRTEFALVLFAGLIVFNLFSECINRAPGLIVANPNYVKKVVFPLEILPWINLGAALFHSLISLVVWLLAYLVFFGVPPATVLYLPLILLPFGLFIMGLSWLLAAVGVFIRDIAQFVGVLTTMLMFLSPIFYPASALPENFRSLLYLNPLTPVIEQTRDIIFWGRTPDFFMLGIYLLTATVIAWLGFAVFQKVRKGFADVL